MIPVKSDDSKCGTRLNSCAPLLECLAHPSTPSRTDQDQRRARAVAVRWVETLNIGVRRRIPIGRWVGTAHEVEVGRWREWHLAVGELHGMKGSIPWKDLSHGSPPHQGPSHGSPPHEGVHPMEALSSIMQAPVR